MLFLDKYMRDNIGFWYRTPKQATDRVPWSFWTLYINIDKVSFTPALVPQLG
jgi:hypothetical protein